MTDLETTNPADASAPEPEVAANEAPAESTDEAPPVDEQDGDEGQQDAEDEFIELEHEGKVAKVPKWAEPLLMFQKDYTQKTQSVAEMRREVEAQRAEIEAEAQTREQLFKEQAQLHTIESRLNQYRNVNWQMWSQQDPQGAQAALADYTQLRDIHQSLNGQVEARKAEIASKREQATAATLAKAVEHLSRPDPNYGWDGKFDAAKRESLTNFGLELGFTNEELANTSHPLMIKTLHLARIGKETLRKQKAVAAPAKTAEPITKVAAGKTRTTVANPDKLPINEWMKWRNKQEAKIRSERHR